VSFHRQREVFVCPPGEEDLLLWTRISKERLPAKEGVPHIRRARLTNGAVRRPVLPVARAARLVTAEDAEKNLSPDLQVS
jgi:hypothetical protein